MREVYFRSARHTIFDALCEHPYGLTIDQLIEIVYHDPDYEPENAKDNIRVVISRANTTFEKLRSPFRFGRSTLGRYVLFLRRVRR